MKIFTLFIGMFGAMPFLGIAHNPKIATFTLRNVPEAGWYIEMSCARSGVDAAMIDYYGESKLKDLDLKMYQDLFVDYAKEHFLLTINNQEDVRLTDGGIRLGSHQTDMKFVLKEIPLQGLHSMRVEISMFQSSFNHTNIFRIYQNETLTKFFLSADNNFTVNLSFAEDGIFAVDPPEKSSFPTIVVTSLSSVILIVLIVLIRRKLLNNTKFSET